MSQPVVIALAVSLLSWPQLVVAGVSNPNPDKFLLVSAPREGKVAYMRVLKGGKMTAVDAKVQGKMEPLISTGLVHPQGLAVEQHAGLLLVADPDAKRVYSYRLSNYESQLSVGERKVLAEGIEARWVAVDGVGNIYFSDEPKNQILKVSTEQALRGGNIEPQVIYDGSSLSQVSSPGGIAVDSFRVYWVNKQAGTREGSVIAAPDGTNGMVFAQGASVAQVKALAKNSDKSYGVCLAYGNVFYTQPEATIYGVKKSGGPTATVTSRLANPRGCTWDGDGTVYVADRGANAVFSFAANMQQIGATEVVKTVDFEDAFGIAVFASARRTVGMPVALLLSLLLLLPALVCSEAPVS